MRTELRALFVAGPTASGKTTLAVAAAERTGAEIVSCDSRQLYSGMRIGTASPTPDERARVPHHLVEVAPPREHWSAGRWADEAARALQAIAARGRPALVVGGSGLYARALRWGIAPLPSNRPLRERLDRLFAGDAAARLHASLERLDPEAARAIHPHNRHRVLRALEVCLTSGRRISELQRRARGRPPRFGAPMVAIDVPREVLQTRIDRRVEAMFAGGLLEEARALLAAGFAPKWPAYRTLGYPEAVACVEGRLSQEEAMARVKRLTWAFARRQLTWLRGEEAVQWLSADPERPEVAARRLEAIVRELSPTPLIPLDAPAHSG